MPVRFIGLATSIVFDGVSAASVLGVLLSSYIGSHIGWRAAFWLMSLLSIIAFISIALIVPMVKNKSTIGIAALSEVMHSNTLWKIYAVVLLAITAHFAAFTFIERWLHGVSSITPNMISVMLFAFGLARLAGNFLTGVLIDKWLKPMVALSIILIATTLITLGQLSSNLSSDRILFLVII